MASRPLYGANVTAHNRTRAGLRLVAVSRFNAGVPLAWRWASAGTRCATACMGRAVWVRVAAGLTPRTSTPFTGWRAEISW